MELYKPRTFTWDFTVFPLLSSQELTVQNMHASLVAIALPSCRVVRVRALANSLAWGEQLFYYLAKSKALLNLLCKTVS